MYITPQNYKCLKCGHEVEYSPHHKHDAPTINDNPLCPKCWSRFILENVGTMACTVDFGKGSEYDELK